MKTKAERISKKLTLQAREFKSGSTKYYRFFFRVPDNHSHYQPYFSAELKITVNCQNGLNDKRMVLMGAKNIFQITIGDYISDHESRKFPQPIR